jgi:hypothetical protein
MSEHLYQLVGDRKGIELALDDYIDAIEAGEMDESALWDTLDGIDGAIEDKADSIVQVIRNKQTLASAIDEEIKRLQARKKAVDKAVDRISAYLSDQLAVIGIDKLDTVHARLSFRSSEKCVISDPAVALNWALANGRADLLTIPEPTPSTSAINAALKGGEKIPGAILVKNRNLQIK